MYLARALVIFPGGFGTMDELFEVLTLQQTRKAQSNIAVVMYGTEYWREVVRFDRLVEWGTITRDELDMIHFVDSVDDAFTLLVEQDSQPESISP